jgi:hypothetical protein
MSIQLPHDLLLHLVSYLQPKNVERYVPYTLFHSTVSLYSAYMGSISSKDLVFATSYFIDTFGSTC